MEIAYVLTMIVQSIGVSLGVGSSTIAVTQFFSAISDGQIDESERRLMGVVYLILRIGMGIVLATTIIEAAIIYHFVGVAYITPFTVGLWAVIAVLFLNAVLMTLHYMPSTFGPGIQAGSWYTLGIMFALVPVGLTGFTYLQFGLFYLGLVLLAIAIVNAAMSYLKK